jgi:hypothetical protein
MNEKARRKQLLSDARHSRPEAGVYCIVNSRSGKALLGSAVNLASVRGKLEFARTTGTPSALDWRSVADAREFGLEALSLEVLEPLETTTDMTPARIRDDLNALEQLWRERLDPSLLY